jgi:hypothetical protein
MAKKQINKDQYRHHHTPDSYYKSFIPKGSDCFIVYDIETDKWWPDNGRNTGYESHLHDVGRIETLPNGRTVNRLEDFFTWTENQANPVYKRWIADERIHAREDVARMCVHLVLLFLRNPKQLQMITNMKVNYTVNKLKKVLQKGDPSVLRHYMPESNLISIMTDKELRAYWLNILDHSISISLDKKDAFWEGLDNNEFFKGLALTFIAMNYQFLKANHTEFVTNDNSVILVPYPFSDTQRSEMSKVVFYSICPQLCLLLGDHGFGEETHRIDEYGVEHFNKVIIQQATRHVVSASYNSRIHELVKEEAKSRRLQRGMGSNLAILHPWPNDPAMGQR